MSDEAKYLRLSAAAARCGIEPRTLRRWAQRRIVPVIRPTRRTLLFAVSELDAALARFRTGPQVARMLTGATTANESSTTSSEAARTGGRRAVRHAADV